MVEKESNNRGRNLLDLQQGCLSHIIAFILHFCDRSYIPLNGNKSFTWVNWTGKKCYMLGARELSIASGNITRCWRWTTLPESRFPEVAELLGVTKLHITGRISTRLLLPDTTYHMYFSFILGPWSCGFDDCPVKVFVSRIDTSGAYLGGGSNSYDAAAKTFYLKAPEKAETDDVFTYLEDVEDDKVSELRGESGHRWMKIYMGNHFNKEDDNVAELEMTLMGTEVYLLKAGIIVHGIEILPID